MRGVDVGVIDGPYFVLTVLGVVGTGLAAGVFCAFSTFVMRGLAALPPAQGVAAMKAINVAAVRPPFMLVFVGSAVLCAVIAVVTFVLWPDEGAVELLVGSALYLFGSFALTMVANVPRNDALLRLEAGTAEAAAYWPTYVREWTMWNHVRTVASAGAAVAYVLALT
nr:anthrone oxygenase family protein [Streptomyces sp. HUCO-GS316]